MSHLIKLWLSSGRSSPQSFPAPARVHCRELNPADSLSCLMLIKTTCNQHFYLQTSLWIFLKTMLSTCMALRTWTANAAVPNITWTVNLSHVLLVVHKPTPVQLHANQRSISAELFSQFQGKSQFTTSCPPKTSQASFKTAGWRCWCRESRTRVRGQSGPFREFQASHACQGESVSKKICKEVGGIKNDKTESIK